jgi:hypothetical protein
MEKPVGYLMLERGRRDTAPFSTGRLAEGTEKILPGRHQIQKVTHGGLS